MMTTVLFLLTMILVLIMTVAIINNAVRRRSIRKKVWLLSAVVLGYTLMWIVFYFARKERPVPFGSEVCFDDWCATVEAMDRSETLGHGANEIRANGMFVILRIRMSNHARGISQKPSEPRIHIKDSRAHFWAFSPAGQQALESVEGKQHDIGERLELHESLETKVVFDIPKEEKGLEAMIEEGPFITNVLLPEDNVVFLLNPG